MDGKESCVSSPRERFKSQRKREQRDEPFFPDIYFTSTVSTIKLNVGRRRKEKEISKWNYSQKKIFFEQLNFSHNFLPPPPILLESSQSAAFTMKIRFELSLVSIQSEIKKIVHSFFIFPNMHINFVNFFQFCDFYQNENSIISEYFTLKYRHPTHVSTSQKIHIHWFVVNINHSELVSVLCMYFADDVFFAIIQTIITIFHLRSRSTLKTKDEEFNLFQIFTFLRSFDDVVLNGFQSTKLGVFAFYFSGCCYIIYPLWFVFKWFVVK